LSTGLAVILVDAKLPASPNFAIPWFCKLQEL
jgi:hypothetical protein